MEENIHGLPEETFKWLERIGGFDTSKFVYFVSETQMHYSLGYLKNTPLDVLQARHEKHLRDYRKDGSTGTELHS